MRTNEDLLRYEYDVALSFAGEDRSTAEELAEGLSAAGLRVFYDRYEQAQLWGKDLYQHLQSVYRDRARYCLILVSAPYVAKLWTKHELRQAQARAFEESREYILPLRLDDTELPGLNATVGYIDLRQNDLRAVQDLVLRKVLGENYEGTDPAELSWRGELVDFRGMQVASFWPMKLAKAQSQISYKIVKEVQRVRYGEEADFMPTTADVPCHDCGAIWGEYHVPTCDMERCPECGRQAISCECIYHFE